MPSARAARGAATVAKLLEAAAAILSDEGAGGISVQRVADAAGTSKGLVHYHFADKDALLTRCAQQLTAEIVAAEAAAFASSTPASALGDLWNVLSGSTYRGRRRALLALATASTLATRAVLADAATERQHAAARTIAGLADLLHFDIPVSRAALALAYLAVIDGLVLDGRGQMGAQQRQAYDAFWLAVLSLTA